jgi:predicted transcriptional regulator
VPSTNAGCACDDMSVHAILFSIRPKFAEMIFAGTKTVELRRVLPRVVAGDLALIYVSSPTRQLQGAFEIGKIVSGPPASLWKKVGCKSGLTRREFLGYFQGKRTGHALVIRKAWKLRVAVCLTTLRKRKNGYQPPQSFHYLNRITSALFTGSGDKTRN